MGKILERNNDPNKAKRFQQVIKKGGKSYYPKKFNFKSYKS